MAKSPTDFQVPMGGKDRQVLPYMLRILSVGVVSLCVGAASGASLSSASASLQVAGLLAALGLGGAVGVLTSRKPFQYGAYAGACFGLGHGPG